MSRMYKQLKAKYDKNYITAATLRGWVEINDRRLGMGITAEEFEQITGEPYAVDAADAME